MRFKLTPTERSEGSEPVGFRLPRSVHTELLEALAETGTELSDGMRQLVMQYLEQRRAESQQCCSEREQQQREGA
jgi:hypothetical protein